MPLELSVIDLSFGPVFGPLLWLALFAASVSDLRWRRVPNALNAAIAIAGLAARAFLERWSGLLDGILGLLVVTLLVLGPFAVRLYRGGDAKLVMALGVWLGPLCGAWMFLFGAAAGGLVALGVLCLAGREARGKMHANLTLAAKTATLPVVEPERSSRLHVPMALAFSIGAVVAVSWR